MLSTLQYFVACVLEGSHHEPGRGRCLGSTTYSRSKTKAAGRVTAPDRVRFRGAPSHHGCTAHQSRARSKCGNNHPQNARLASTRCFWPTAQAPLGHCSSVACLDLSVHVETPYGVGHVAMVVGFGPVMCSAGYRVVFTIGWTTRQVLSLSELRTRWTVHGYLA